MTVESKVDPRKRTTRMLSNLATLLLAALEVFRYFRSMIPNTSLIFGQLPFTSI